jgi:Ca-activated chloride channel homolog
MRFANPFLLNWLWLLPVLWLALKFILKRRQQKMAKVIEQGLIDQVTSEFSLAKLKRKNYALLACYVFLVIALARPQWGFTIEKVKQQGLDIILAVDVSKSMMTQDIKPSRLERSKMAIKDLLKKVHGDRIGLIAFAGTAFMTCPLTVDYSGFSMSLDDLRIDSIPVGGTNIERVIKEALRTFGTDQLKYKALVILTDGEEVQGNALEAAKQAKEKGIRIFTIGIGTKEGDLIQVPQEDGSKAFLKDEQGNFVKSRLNEEVLSKIAYETGGAYVRSSGAEFGLEYLYTQELSKWKKRDFEEKTQKKYYEQFQWPLGLGILCLMLSL